MQAIGNTELVEQARRVFPGGVSTGNRVLPWPMAIVDAQGAHAVDDLA